MLAQVNGDLQQQVQGTFGGGAENDLCAYWGRAEAWAHLICLLLEEK